MTWDNAITVRRIVDDFFNFGKFLWKKLLRFLKTYVSTKYKSNFLLLFRTDLDVDVQNCKTKRREGRHTHTHTYTPIHIGMKLCVYSNTPIYIHTHTTSHTHTHTITHTITHTHTITRTHRGRRLTSYLNLIDTS